jgi:hypothetical protein
VTLRRILFFAITAAVCVSGARFAHAASSGRDDLIAAWETGDLVFHRSRSAQAEAIAAATGSPLTHVGVVVKEDEQTWVYEAVEPVQRTVASSWIRRGVPGTLAVFRPDGLSSDTRQRLVRALKRHLGTPYDAAFAPGPDQLYCSEYVDLAFREAGLVLAEPEPLSALSTNDPSVRTLFGKRWRTHPWCRAATSAADCARMTATMPMITPARLSQSPKLVQVFPPG